MVACGKSREKLARDALLSRPPRRSAYRSTIGVVPLRLKLKHSSVLERTQVEALFYMPASCACIPLLTGTIVRASSRSRPRCGHLGLPCCQSSRGAEDMAAHDNAVAPAAPFARRGLSNRLRKLLADAHRRRERRPQHEVPSKHGKRHAVVRRKRGMLHRSLVGSSSMRPLRRYVNLAESAMLLSQGARRATEMMREADEEAAREADSATTTADAA